MTKKFPVFALMGLGAGLLSGTAFAQTPTTTSAAGPVPQKIGVLEVQTAIFKTKDGQKALADLQSRFSPKKNELDAKKAEIAQAEDQYRKGANTMSEEARQKIMRDIDVKTKALNRDTDDANADLEQANQKIMSDLGNKMLALVNQYANQNGYALVIDVSNPQSPVLFASNAIDITREMIDLYDQKASSLSLTTPAPSAARPTASAPVRRPAAPPK